MVQFLKYGDSGESILFKELMKSNNKISSLLKWINLGTKEFVSPDNLSSYPALVNSALIYGFLNYLWPRIKESFKPKLTVFDELGIAMHMGLVDEELVLNVVEPFRKCLNEHLIITGRYMPKSLIEIADLVSNVDEVKHYFREGFKSIKGLDY